jgi:hypothetical protein
MFASGLQPPNQQQCAAISHPSLDAEPLADDREVSDVIAVHGAASGTSTGTAKPGAKPG